MLSDDESIYHGCANCGWPESVWSHAFGEWLCKMCLDKRTICDLDAYPNPVLLSLLDRQLRLRQETQQGGENAI